MRRPRSSTIRNGPGRMDRASIRCKTAIQDPANRAQPDPGPRQGPHSVDSRHKGRDESPDRNRRRLKQRAVTTYR